MISAGSNRPADARSRVRRRLRSTAGGVAILGLLLLAGCITRAPTPRLTEQIGESLVFIGAEPSVLAFPPAPGRPFRLRSTYVPGPATIDYVEGRDFSLDRADGTVRRLPGSRLPDFAGNPLHGQEAFDHTKFSGYGNTPYFAFADYTLAEPVRWPSQPAQRGQLRTTQAKLTSGGAVKIVAFGDSITAGGEATAPGLVFWQRWADDLQAKHPRARVTTVNAATGGDTTTRGLQRLDAKVIAARPDLVLIGFGMNDHNRRGVPLPDFERQLREMIARIRKETTAEIVVLSAFPPNPRWVHGSQRMAEYAAVTARVARETACAYADVFANWQAMAARKRPEDLLANNINHPNDFGHWIYSRVLGGLGL
jgi:lysophospholipase L1-like esterase